MTLPPPTPCFSTEKERKVTHTLKKRISLLAIYELPLRALGRESDTISLKPPLLSF